jgi:hypothetical protein
MQRKAKTNNPALHPQSCILENKLLEAGSAGATRPASSYLHIYTNDEMVFRIGRFN